MLAPADAMPPITTATKHDKGADAYADMGAAGGPGAGSASANASANTVQAQVGHGDKCSNNDDDDDTDGAVSLIQLYRFSTPLDVLALLIGTISAAAGGAVTSALAILLGRVMTRESHSRSASAPAD